MSVLDASLALQWFLEDEENRKYSLAVLASLSEKRALVPLLWFHEVGNGLLMACRRKRISLDQVDGLTGYWARIGKTTHLPENNCARFDHVPQ